MPILLIVLLAVAVGLAVSYNFLVSLRNQTRNAWKQIDVQLRRRYDLIPNLVEVVKDYMAYEKETLETVVRARNAAAAAHGVAAQAEAEGRLSGSLRRLFAVFENYPDLKANQSVARLLEELATTENRIAFARQYYNDMVLRLNNAVEKFPTNLVARSFGFSEEEYFEVAEAAAREPVKADLR
jgi:LemA protein